MQRTIWIDSFLKATSLQKFTHQQILLILLITHPLLLTHKEYIRWGIGGIGHRDLRSPTRIEILSDACVYIGINKVGHNGWQLIYVHMPHAVNAPSCFDDSDVSSSKSKIIMFVIKNQVINVIHS